MLALGLDSSLREASLALVRDDTVLAETRLSAEARSNLGEPLAHLLESAHVSVSDLELVSVGLGPGSFTGVRMGVTFAKTLAWALHCPLVGLSGLLALARDATREGEVLVLLRARPGHVYGGTYLVSDGVPKTLAPPALRKLSDVLPQLEANALVVTDDPDEVRSLSTDRPLKVCQAGAPSAATLARLACAHLLAGGEPDDPMTLQPTYCQESAPERRA